MYTYSVYLQHSICIPPSPAGLQCGLGDPPPKKRGRHRKKTCLRSFWGCMAGTRAQTAAGSAAAAATGVVIRRGPGAETRDAAGAKAAAVKHEGCMSPARAPRTCPAVARGASAATLGLAAVDRRGSPVARASTALGGPNQVPVSDPARPRMSVFKNRTLGGVLYHALHVRTSVNVVHHSLQGRHGVEWGKRCARQGRAPKPHPIPLETSATSIPYSFGAKGRGVKGRDTPHLTTFNVNFCHSAVVGCPVGIVVLWSPG